MLGNFKLYSLTGQKQTDWKFSKQVNFGWHGKKLQILCPEYQWQRRLMSACITLPAVEVWCSPARRTRCSVWVWCAGWGPFQKLAVPASGWSAAIDYVSCQGTSAHRAWWEWAAHTETWPPRSSSGRWADSPSELDGYRYTGTGPSHLIVPAKNASGCIITYTSNILVRLVLDQKRTRPELEYK